MAQATLDTVYKSLLDEDQNMNNRNIQPTVTLDDGIVNVYISLETAEPANAAAMILDTTIDATGSNKSFLFTGMCKWILFEQSSGVTAEIFDMGVIVA